MPTVILLDVSLSMFRPVPSSDSAEHHTRFSLACSAINTFLDYLNVHAKLEYVALVTFSSGYDVAVPFTRDLEAVRAKLPQLEEGDRTSLPAALQGVSQLVLGEWGHQTLVQILLVSDGSIGCGAAGRARCVAALPPPPLYPARLHVLPAAAPHEPSLQHAMPMYQKMVELVSSAANQATPVQRGLIYCPDQLSVLGMTSAVTRLCEQQYQPCWSTLRCGRHESRVQLVPPAPGVPSMHVIGFLDQQDLGTPIIVSKHLIIPQPQLGAPRDNYDPKTPTKEGSNSNDGSTNEEDSSDPSKIPNFCVLLHGAMKVEGMSALVQLGPDRWGVVSAWCEAVRARRSALLLCALLPGPLPAPWCGPLNQLGTETTGSESFPIRAVRSYSGGAGAGAGGGAWARPHALLADVQKVLRHARKLPDKTQQLYKELNRLRRAAISLGFSELLTCVETALSRECAALPPSAPPEAHAQLAHALAALRDRATALDIKHTITPLAVSH